MRLQQRQRAGMLVVAVLLAGAASGCARDPAPGPEMELSLEIPGRHNMLTDEERAAGWRLLFDGRTTEGWRGFRRETMPDGWQVVDGALTRVDRAGDIITVDEFGDFELELDWKIEPGGNSGIFFRVSEEAEAIWHAAPEVQLLDDDAHRGKLEPEQYTGANYDLHAPARDVTRPAGEWNHLRLVVNGNQVEHWLNGEKIVEYELGSADWIDRVNRSKFKEHPQYGRIRRGPIGLQDHGDRVAFRNVRIRPLGPTETE